MPAKSYAHKESSKVNINRQNADNFVKDARELPEIGKLTYVDSQMADVLKHNFLKKSMEDQVARDTKRKAELKIKIAAQNEKYRKYRGCEQSSHISSSSRMEPRFSVGKKRLGSDLSKNSFTTREVAAAYDNEKEDSTISPPLRVDPYNFLTRNNTQDQLTAHQKSSSDQLVK